MKPLSPTSKFRALPLLLAIALTGCGDFMDPPSLDVALPESWSQTQKLPDAQTRPEDKPAPLARDWWKAANDPTLNALMEKIEKDNLSLVQARFRLQAARSETGGSQFLPTLSADQSVNFEPVSTFLEANTPGGVPDHTHIDSDFGGYHKLGLDAQWEIPLFGSYHAASEEAKADISFAEADIDAVRAAVYAEAVTNYIELRAAQNKLATLKDMEASQAHVVKLFGIRVDAGLSDSIEHEKAQQMLIATRKEITLGESAVIIAKQRIAKLEGTATPDAALDAPGPLVTFPPMQFADTPVDVVRNRPDIRKAEQSVIIAADELKLAKNERYPKLVIEGELFKFNNIINHPQPDTAPAGSLTEGITLPLFDWGRLLAAAQAKDAKLAESAATYRETVIGAITEVEQMLASYQAAQADRVSAAESATHGDAIAKHAAVLNSQGLTDKIALETAAMAQQRAKIDTADATANESISLANLAKALGGGLATKTETERAKQD